MISQLNEKRKELAELRINYRRMLSKKEFSTRNFDIPKNNKQKEQMIQKFMFIEQYFTPKEMLIIEDPVNQHAGDRFQNRRSFLLLRKNNYQNRINSLAKVIETVNTQFRNKAKKPTNVMKYIKRREIGLKPKRKNTNCKYI